MSVPLPKKIFRVAILPVTGFTVALIADAHYFQQELSWLRAQQIKVRRPITSCGS